MFWTCLVSGYGARGHESEVGWAPGRWEFGDDGCCIGLLSGGEVGPGCGWNEGWRSLENIIFGADGLGQDNMIGGFIQGDSEIGMVRNDDDVAQ